MNLKFCVICDFFFFFLNLKSQVVVRLATPNSDGRSRDIGDMTRGGPISAEFRPLGMYYHL
jgi:hypothetical protein